MAQIAEHRTMVLVIEDDEIAKTSPREGQPNHLFAFYQQAVARHPRCTDSARRLRLDVLTPKTLRNDDALAAFRAHGADAAIVVAYGLILPPAEFAVLTISVQPSLFSCAALAIQEPFWRARDLLDAQHRLRC